MNAEYLLDAVGLLDDDLIQQAEEYRRPRVNVRPWVGLAACLAVVLTLGYAVTHIGMGGGASGGNMTGTPAASAPSGGTETPPPESPEQNGEDFPAGPSASAGAESLAIMVDGVLYRSTGEAVPGEPDPSVIQTASSYTDGVPEEDGQSNIVPPVRYAETDLGLVVLVEEEWILFEPVE